MLSRRAAIFVLFAALATLPVWFYIDELLAPDSFSDSGLFFGTIGHFQIFVMIWWINSRTGRFWDTRRASNLPIVDQLPHWQILVPRQP